MAVDSRIGLAGMKACETEGCEKPVFAREMCQACYVRWKRATNHNGFADIQRAKDKAWQLSDEGAAAEQARWERRKAQPGFRERRREIHAAFADRHDPIGMGKTVEVAIADLAEFAPNKKRPRQPCREESPLVIRGVVVGRGRRERLVRFATFEEWVFAQRVRAPEGEDTRG